MPRKYEEEINEILHKYDWPPAPKSAPKRARQRRRAEPALHLDSFSPYQLMALGLIFILAGAAIHFLGFASGVALGTYATWIGVLALFAGYIMAVASVRSGRLPRQRMWRGEVIDITPRGRGLAYWWWRLTSTFRRH